MFLGKLRGHVLKIRKQQTYRYKMKSRIFHAQLLLCCSLTAAIII